MFTRKSGKIKDVPTIEMMLDHDGQDWIVSGGDLRIAAKELDDIDRQLETALQSQLVKASM